MMKMVRPLSRLEYSHVSESDNWDKQDNCGRGLR